MNVKPKWRKHPPPDGGDSRRRRCLSGRRAVNRIALSRAITFSGGNAAFLALLIVLFEQTHSAALVAAGFVASFGVPALASPVAGLIGDSFDRKRVMITSEMVGALCFLLMAAVTPAPVALIVLRIAASLAAAPFVPASGAALPRLVGRAEELPSANAKIAEAGIIGGLAGPILAAGILLVADAHVVFALNAATFVLSSALLVSISGDFRPVTSDPVKGDPSALAAGFRYLKSHRVLGPVTVGYAIIFFGVGITGPAEVVLNNEFDAGATGLAAMTAIFSIGGLVGARLGAVFAKGNTPPAILTSASAALAVGFLAVGAAPLFALVLVGMAVGGAADSVWRVAHEYLVQAETPDSVRSRVLAASEAAELAAMTLGFLCAGVVISLTSAAGAFAIGGVGSVIVFLFFITKGARPVPAVAGAGPEPRRRDAGGLIGPASPRLGPLANQATR